MAAGCDTDGCKCICVTCAHHWGRWFYLKKNEGEWIYNGYIKWDTSHICASILPDPLEPTHTVNVMIVVSNSSHSGDCLGRTKNQNGLLLTLELGANEEMKHEMMFFFSIKTGLSLRASTDGRSKDSFHLFEPRSIFLLVLQVKKIQSLRFTKQKNNNWNVLLDGFSLKLRGKMGSFPPPFRGLSP